MLVKFLNEKIYEKINIDFFKKVFDNEFIVIRFKHFFSTVTYLYSSDKKPYLNYIKIEKYSYKNLHEIK